LWVRKVDLLKKKKGWEDKIKLKEMQGTPGCETDDVKERSVPTSHQAKYARTGKSFTTGKRNNRQHGFPRKTSRGPSSRCHQGGLSSY